MRTQLTHGLICAIDSYAVLNLKEDAMNKKTIAIVLTVVIVALVLFLPIPQGPYDDGGTREYVALTYRIVVWNRYNSIYDENGTMVGLEKYSKTSVYWFPDNFKSYSELWQMEMENTG